jgi:hypothetical protein
MSRQNKIFFIAEDHKAEKKREVKNLPLSFLFILLFHTTLHSKADRGGDEKSTQAYVLVRRAV